MRDMDDVMRDREAMGRAIDARREEVRATLTMFVESCSWY